MPDYPDWQQIFRLVGSDITINVNIEASAVTLPVNITGAITLDVDITAQSVGNLSVNLAASAITLNVNLAAQSANISISFADQSVAVFDAAKWFAHQAQQIYLNGTVYLENNHTGIAITRTVPAGKVFFITGVGCVADAASAIPESTSVQIRVDAAIMVRLGSVAGLGVIFDTPIRVTAGKVVDVRVWWWSPTAGWCDTEASLWGYDEVA